VKSMAWCLRCKLICYLSVVYGNGDGMGIVVCGDGWGWGQSYAGMDGDGNDLETSCRDRGGDGDYCSGDGFKYLSP